MLRLEIKQVGAEWTPVRWENQATAFERDLAHLLGLWVRRLATEAKRRAPVDTGRLRAAITAEVRSRAGAYLGIVGVAAFNGGFNYAVGQEFGTGIHSVYPGAPKQPIRPKHGKALKIPLGRFAGIRQLPAGAQAAQAVGPRAVAAFAFRGSVRGVKPQPFLTPLLQEFGPRIDADLQRLCARYGFV